MGLLLARACVYFQRGRVFTQTRQRPRRAYRQRLRLFLLVAGWGLMGWLVFSQSQGRRRFKSLPPLGPQLADLGDQLTYQFGREPRSVPHPSVKPNHPLSGF